MYAVNQAINNLDDKLEKDICKTGNPYARSSAAKEEEGKCGIGKGSSSSSTASGFSKLWDTTTAAGSTSGGDYDKTSTDNMGQHTSTTISRDIIALNRDQKGVVSSAFAKAHEGAEIVDSTRYTSSMYIY